MRELTDIKKNDRDTVAISNNFARARKEPLGLTATSLLAWAISQIRTTDDQLVKFKLTPENFAKSFKSKSSKRDLKRVTQELRDFVVWVKNDQGIEEDFNVVPSRCYDSNTGEYILEFHVKMHQHLLVQNNFTAEKLQVFTSAENKYCFPFYNLLLSELRGRAKGEFEIELSFLKDAIGAKAKTYDKFSELERGVLKKVKKEFEEISDLKFTYKSGHRGKRGKMETLIFSVHKGASQPPLLNESNPLERIEESEPVADIITPSDARNLIPESLR